MDENSELIDNFESVLKKRSCIGPSTLYKGKINRNFANKTHNQNLNSQSIISNVAKQIKAMQNSDTVRSDRNKIINMKKYGKSSFLPLNMLHERVTSHQPAPKFDTQLISDTQLINVLDDAEALDVNSGMTQEFQTTFFNGNDNTGTHCNQNPTQKEEIFPILDISLKDPDPSIALTPPKHNESKNYDAFMRSNESPNDKQSNQVLNTCMGVEELDTQLQDNVQALIIEANLIQKPPSPVFNIKSKKNRCDTSPSLVFNLDAFENFEKIAMPVIEQTPDNEEARFLINSQIIGKELVLQTYVDDNEPPSPIIEISNDLAEIDKELIALTAKELSCKDNKDVIIDEKEIFEDKEDCNFKDSTRSDNFIKDEILFSSDEEEGYEHQSYKDLPFTCALETSFYDTSEILDKTMFVGFQTASNKSIQIGTDSFCKAKSLLNSVERDLKNEATLTELVEMCESIVTSSRVRDANETASITKTIPTNFPMGDDPTNRNDPGNSTTGVEVTVNEYDPIRNTSTEKDNALSDALVFADNKFEGFKTVSNKVITLSEKALEKSKKVFQNIDLYENLEFEVETPKNPEKNERYSPSTITKKEDLPESIVKHDVTEEENIDDDLIKEFQEDLMHTEFEYIFKDIERDKELITDKSKQIDDEPKVDGFKTASNKNIHISDAALAKSKKLFQDIDLTVNSDIKEQPSTSDKKLQANNDSIGFKTASNKLIRISAKALEKTKAIFNDIDFNNDDIDFNVTNKKEKSFNSNILQRQILGNITDRPSTIKNNNIEDKYKEINASIEVTSGLKNSERNKTEFIDFKTASAEVLSKSKKIYIVIDKDEEEEDEKEPPFYGFEQTDKYIGLVEETLEKSQKIFEKLTHRETNVYASELTNRQIVQMTPELKTTIINLDINASLNTKQKHTDTLKITELQPDINKETNTESKNKTLRQDNDNAGNRISNTDLRFNVDIKTTSNKEVKISEKALNKSRNIFQNINEDKPLQTDAEVGFEEDTITKFTMQGFRTASNKNVTISETALAKSRHIFQDMNDDKSIQINTEYGNTDTKFKGFQTASRKEVKISKEALAKSKKIFQDIDDVNVDIFNRDTKPLFKGFKTASNKKVLISENALERSRNLFRDMSEQELNVNNFNEKRANINTDLKFKGFQTASNKKVNISEEALAKSRELFKDIPFNESEETDSGNLDTDKLNTNSTFKGFQTASNKEVKISKTALEKSRKIFQEIVEDKSIETTTENYGTDKLHTTFKGFQTASDKDVKISAEALAKSKKIFQDINDDTLVELNARNPITKSIDADTVPKFIGFLTARNKEVKISSEALAESKKMFQDINDSESVEINAVKSKIGTNSKFTSFQTASNKEVKISNDALARSKKIFDDIEDVKPRTHNKELRHMNTIIDFNFKGFQTANNKNVRISDEALARSYKVFQDVDVDRSCTTACNYKTPKFAGRSNVKDDDIKRSNTKIDEDTMTKSIAENKYNDVIDNVNTQLLNNFEESMHETTPKKSKRCGSPILSCPKAKKRKIFQIPYSQKSPKKSTDFKPPTTIQKSDNVYNFSLTYKKTKMYTLKDLQKLEENTTAQSNTDPYILKFNFENLHQFEFTDLRNDVTNSILTLSELKNIFLNSANKKLIPDGWLDIQLKLVLWKLISYELKFPKTMPLTCTAKNVIEQLKYRYDKELYNAERPALRKIFERDDRPGKTLVSCVVAICEAQDTSQPPELILTDGWYTIKTVIDKMLSRLVGNGKISVGTKLVTHGAELVGSEQAASPWEDTSSLRLKIFGNSTRRARWDARLGYHSNGAILSQLSTVALDGGKVSKLRVFVARVYPPLYVDKFEDGSTVTRSERLEHLHQMKFETETQALLEKIYEDVEKEVMEQDSQDSEVVIDSGSKRKFLDSGSQIAKLMKRSRDPAEFRSHLTSTQTALLEEHTTRDRERLLQDIQARVQNKMAALGVTLNRNVVTLLKVRVAGVDERNAVGVTRALLSIWRPNEAVIEIIKEGTWIEILNVVPTAMRYSELQISAGRQSIFYQTKYKDNEKATCTASLKRTCYPIKDLVKNPAMTTDYNEIDTVGIVIEVDPTINNFDANKHQFQNVYLADADKDIISVNFWGGLKKFGFENVLDTGQIVAGINLQKRAGNSRKNIPQYRVTEYSYFTKTPKCETARKIIEELGQKLCKIDKKLFYQECVTLKNNYSARQLLNENVTPYRFPNFDMNLSRNRIFLDSPLAQNSNKKDENLNLTGLDFDSTFNQTNTQELSPKTLLRKQQVKEKIARLKRYGEPPPLSPMQIINKSKNAANAYKSPLISKSDVSLSVASSERNLPNREKKSKDVSDAGIQCSPVICLNRTYVTYNPVKLNFSKNENSISDNVDEFAEEFDCSPPLSLD